MLLIGLWYRNGILYVYIICISFYTALQTHPLLFLTFVPLNIITSGLNKPTKTLSTFVQICMICICNTKLLQSVWAISPINVFKCQLLLTVDSFIFDSFKSQLIVDLVGWKMNQTQILYHFILYFESVLWSTRRWKFLTVFAY